MIHKDLAVKVWSEQLVTETDAGFVGDKHPRVRRNSCPADALDVHKPGR